MHYFARFEEIDGETFRFDTRIYLNGRDPERESICVGAIVGKNPGSATSKARGEFMPLDLNGDKMLPAVRSRFLHAYKQAGKQAPLNAFVRVWNLFYICDRDLNSALEKVSKFQSPRTCSSENEIAPIVWYGWGGANPELDSFKERFVNRDCLHHFFYDHRQSEVVLQKPEGDAFARHTQGMPAKPVVDHLAKYF